MGVVVANSAAFRCETEPLFRRAAEMISEHEKRACERSWAAAHERRDWWPPLT